MVFVFKVIRVFLISNDILQQSDTFREKYLAYIKPVFILTSSNWKYSY